MKLVTKSRYEFKRSNDSDGLYYTSKCGTEVGVFTVISSQMKVNRPLDEIREQQCIELIKCLKRTLKFSMKTNSHSNPTIICVDSIEPSMKFFVKKGVTYVECRLEVCIPTCPCESLEEINAIA